MPIQLNSPHTHHPGHGKPPVNYSFVMIVNMTIHTSSQPLMRLTLRYGNVVDGAWVDSPEPPHRVLIKNHPAVLQSGPDPITGEWTTVEVTPANPQFDNMKAAFIIDGSMAGWETYDVLGYQLYTWLLANGYYEGTIV